MIQDLSGLWCIKGTGESMAVFLWGDLDQDQRSKICLDDGASKEPANPWLSSFEVIWIRISDPRSVWMMVHQRNRQIHGCVPLG